MRLKYCLQTSEQRPNWVMELRLLRRARIIGVQNSTPSNHGLDFILSMTIQVWLMLYQFCPHSCLSPHHFLFLYYLTPTKGDISFSNLMRKVYSDGEVFFLSKGIGTKCWSFRIRSILEKEKITFEINLRLPL